LDSPHKFSNLIATVISRLREVDGIAAIALGGSRAKGDANEKSDIDIALYYASEYPIDIVALDQIARQLDDEHRPNIVTPVYEWGRWINGGGWLRVQSTPIDFLYRDLAHVSAVIDECHAGKITIDYQPGHPHGFVSSIYMGEINLCLPLHDPQGILQKLKTRTSPYPARLKHATIEKFAWEISFSLSAAKKAIDRNDIGYAAGCCFRSVACLNQVLFALNETYLLNEKGATAIADRFAFRPTNYRARIESAFALLVADASSIKNAIAILSEIERELSKAHLESDSSKGFDF
jgi:predicted nucleotidyltransferase